jgi:hypothetical protein
VQHSTLVAMGVRWLSRRCSVVLYEFATAADENPDVIGWVPGADSVLIECKFDSCGFPKGRDEGCPEESACRNGPAAILSVSTGCDPGEGPSSEMGTALGRQGPNNGRARVAGPPRKKPRGRSPVPQFDAQACPNTNRCPPAFGMAERRESLRGKAWHSAQPTSGNAENEPHTSLDGSLLVRPVFARADCGAATDGQPIRQRYRTISEAIRPAKDPCPTLHARRRVEAYSAAAFAAFLVFDQTVRQHLGDRRTSPQRSFEARRKAAGRPCELAQLPTWGLERSGLRPRLSGACYALVEWQPSAERNSPRGEPSTLL